GGQRTIEFGTAGPSPAAEAQRRRGIDQKEPKAHRRLESLRRPAPTGGCRLAPRPCTITNQERHRTKPALCFLPRIVRFVRYTRGIIVHRLARPTRSRSGPWPRNTSGGRRGVGVGDD